MEIASLKSLLVRSTEKYREVLAYQKREDGGYRKITYGRVLELAKAVQKALVNFGVGQGDRVALVSENRPEWPVSYLAITSMGAVAIPLDSMLSKEEISPLLKDAGPKAIILSKKYAEHIQGSGLEERRLFMEEMGGLPVPQSLAEVEPKSDDLAAILYTSGTTGIPKGVMLTHGNIVSNVIGVSTRYEGGPSDTFFMILPLHHGFETVAGLLSPFYKGCQKTFPESLKPQDLLRNMQETGVTIMGGPPLFYQLLFDGMLRELEEKKLKWVFSLLFAISGFFRNVLGLKAGKILFAIVHKKFGGKIRFMITGGAVIDPKLIINYELMGIPLLQGYGLAEASPIIAVEGLSEHRIGSVGKPMPEVEVRISGAGPVGEILVKGPNVMKGYYKNERLTAEIITDGWLHTGDLGYLDKDGYLFVTGRTKDLIVTGAGVSIYPEEIEVLLDRIPAIKESCALGAKVEAGARKGTEEVMAVIVPDMEYFEKIGHKEDDFIKAIISKEIESYNKKVVSYKRVARFIIRKEELPRTRLKKIKRFLVKSELK